MIEDEFCKLAKMINALKQFKVIRKVFLLITIAMPSNLVPTSFNPPISKQDAGKRLKKFKLRSLLYGALISSGLDHIIFNIHIHNTLSHSKNKLSLYTQYPCFS